MLSEHIKQTNIQWFRVVSYALSYVDEKKVGVTNLSLSCVHLA